MTVNVTVSPDQTTDSVPPSLHVAATPTAYTANEQAGRQAPFFVPRDQAYYWTLLWQRGEAEALHEIAEGNVRRFNSGAAAAEWLLGDGDL